MHRFHLCTHRNLTSQELRREERGEGRQLKQTAEEKGWEKEECCEGEEEGRRKGGMSKAHISDVHEGVNIKRKCD